MGNYIPQIAESEIMNRADRVLLVGADPMMTHVPWSSPLPTCELVARANYDVLSLTPNVRVDGDLKKSLNALAGLHLAGFALEEIKESTQAILPHFDRPKRARFTAHDIIEITQSLMPSEGILVSETGIFLPMLERMWLVERRGSFLGTAGGRTMGLTLPAILGAKLARPEIPMIGLGADGSLLMRLGELEVFARTGVNVPLIIVDDQALGTMKSRQKSRGMPEYELDLQPVDYAQVAAACGLHSARVETPEEFEQALRSALSAEKTTLIDARVDPRPYQDAFGPTIGSLP